MEQILGTAGIGGQRAVHIATLSRQSVIDNDAEHLGFDGYFLFETSDEPSKRGIQILGKCCSLEAALRLIEIWDLHAHPNQSQDG